MAKQTTNMSSSGAPKIRVKQDMIDFIKTQGMTRALKRAGQISAKGTKGEAEFLEGVRRMYGANRLAAATKAAGVAKAAPYSASSKTQPAPKTAAYAAGKAKSSTTTGPRASTTSTTPKPKAKSSGFHVTGKEIAGGVTALALLAASRGKATGVAAKLAPRLTKALSVNSGKTAANVMAKKISSIKTSGADKALSASGRLAAKAGRPVSQSQYDAMQAAARGAGRGMGRGAAKTAAKPAAKATAKTTAKKTTVKKAGAGAGATTLKGGKKK
jgi:hypothetical protein